MAKIIFLVILFIFCFSYQTFAGNLCDSIINIECGVDITFNTSVGYGNILYFNGMNTSCKSTSGQGGKEVLYRYIANRKGTYNFKVVSTSNTTQVEYFYKKNPIDSCNESNWLCLGYRNTPGLLKSINLNFLDTIYILVNSENFTAASQVFRIECALPYACENIQTIYSGTNVVFSPEPLFGNPLMPDNFSNCTVYQPSENGPEKMYKFVAPIEGTYTLRLLNATFNKNVSYLYKKANSTLYNDPCNSNNWVCIKTTSEPYIITAINLNENDSIYLLLNANYSSGQTQTFRIEYTAPFPCKTISEIKCDSLVTFTTTANNIGNPDYPSGLNSNCFPFPTQSPHDGPETMYLFVAPDTGYYNIKVVNVISTNTNVEYYYKYKCLHPPPPNTTCLNNGTEACDTYGWECIAKYGINKTGYIGVITLNKGDSIFIMLNADYLTGVTHQFKITCAKPLPCKSSRAITCNEIINFNSDGLRGQPNIININNSCGGSIRYTGEFLYFLFSPPISGIYNLNIISVLNNNHIKYLYKDNVIGFPCGTFYLGCIADVNDTGIAGSIYLSMYNTYTFVVMADSINTFSQQSFSLTCGKVKACENPIKIGCDTIVEFKTDALYGASDYSGDLTSATPYAYKCNGVNLVPFNGEETEYIFKVPNSGYYSIEVDSILNSNKVAYYYKLGKGYSCRNSSVAYEWRCIGVTDTVAQFNNFYLNTNDSIYILLDSEKPKITKQYFKIQCNPLLLNKKLNPELIIYPVPSNDFLYIKHLISKMNYYKIFNIDGKQIIEGRIIEDEINIKELQKGTYIIEIYDNFSEYHIRRMFIK